MVSLLLDFLRFASQKRPDGAKHCDETGGSSDKVGDGLC